MFELLCWIIIFFIIDSMRARSLTDEMKKRIKAEGLVHMTTPQAAGKIDIGNNEIHLLPSRFLSSYSNFFRPATFFFCGFPKRSERLFNVNWEKNISTMNFMAYIFPEDIDEQLLSQLKFRRLDKAVMIPKGYIGKGTILIEKD